MLALPFDPISSPLAAATAWMLERVFRGDLSAEHVRDERLWHLTGPVEEVMLRFDRTRRAITAVSAYEEIRSDLSRAWVVDDRSRRMVLRVWMHPDHPGVPSRFSQVLAPEGYAVRPALQSDAPAMRALELQVPVERGDGTSVVYDRPDPFAQLRLMGDVSPMLAEFEGQVVGVHVDAFQDVRIAGTVVPSMYRLHTRVLPEHQGAGLYGTMTGAQLERLPASEAFPVMRAMAAVGNTKVDRFVYWDTTVTQLHLDCAATASTSTSGDPAVDADAARIANVLECTHAGKELFVGATETTVRSRLSRSPSDYGFGDVLLTDRAVAGVWDPGWWITTRRDDPAVDRRRIAILADWGALPGAEAELVDLVRRHCAALALRGVTHLMTFADGTTSAGEALRALAASTIEFRHSCALPEPPETHRRGIFIDPVWF